MLDIENLRCGYGSMDAVHDLSLEVPSGKIVALLGPNGAGKTSTIMSVAGHVQVKAGRISFEGKDISLVPPHRRVELGIAVVPEGRRLFSDLSVKDNLVVGGYSLSKARANENRERVFAIFPRLQERVDQIASSLSGGEQQMLAMGRALMASPRLLMVDELSLGLMPKAIDACYSVLEKLRESGVTILLVEQSTERAIRVADIVCVMESGVVVWRGSASDAREDPRLIAAYLGIDPDRQ
jgi:branched-chain amino acid transport system ATP-binding protein